jgi:hypothetical protein
LKLDDEDGHITVSQTSKFPSIPENKRDTGMSNTLRNNSVFQNFKKEKNAAMRNYAEMIFEDNDLPEKLDTLMYNEFDLIPRMKNNNAYGIWPNPNLSTLLNSNNYNTY